MRQSPKISEEAILACLHTQYGLDVISARYLPIGYDLNAFVYEAFTMDGTSYFVKLRNGDASLASLLVPRMLIEAGIAHIIAPLRTKAQALWCRLDTYSVTVSPFVHGDNAMRRGMSEQQWREFGKTLQAIHSGGFAARLQEQVPAETFSLPSARLVRDLSAQLPNIQLQSPVASHLKAYWTQNAAWIEHLLHRAETLGKQLQEQRWELVLCHADIHAANILISEAGKIFLVDWDGPRLAPRERDLLFVVGSMIARRVQAHEEAWFFEGYGRVEVNWNALAYYRYERAIEDIGETGKSVFLNPDQSEAEKAEEAALFHGLFAPGDIVEAAMEADRRVSGPSKVTLR